MNRRRVFLEMELLISNLMMSKHRLIREFVQEIRAENSDRLLEQLFD